MSYREKYGRWALVVGGSTTIGEQFCRQLAAQGMDVIMVARQRDLLEQLARDIESKHAVQARAVALDLTAGGSIERLLAETAELEVGMTNSFLDGEEVKNPPESSRRLVRRE